MHISSISVSHGTTPTVVQPRAAPAGAPVDEAQRQTSPAARGPQIRCSEATAQETTALSEAEVRQLRELKARDREVRAHEQAHVAAGGALVRGGARFSYQQGPDGRDYAVGGEVSIGGAEASGKPEQTARNAEQIQRAAVAPANPSAQDRAVAAQAAATATRAHREVAQAQRSETAEARLTADTASRNDAEQINPSRNKEIALYKSIAALDEIATARANQVAVHVA